MAMLRNTILISRYALLAYFGGLIFQNSFCEVVPIKRLKHKNIYCHSVFEITLKNWRLCADICARMSICKSAFYYENVKVCQINDDDKGFYNDEDGSLIRASDIPLAFYGACRNQECGMNEICIPKYPEFDCLPLSFNQTSWVRYKNHLYYFSRKCADWSDAQENCRKHNANLVTIDDVEENDWISSMLKGKEFSILWIGASRKDAQGPWLWVADNSSMTYRVNYYSLNEGSLTQNCLKMSPQAGTWSPEVCGLYRTYMCEK